METKNVSRPKKVIQHVRRHKTKYITGGLFFMFVSMFGMTLSIGRKVDETHEALDMLKSTRSKLTTVPNVGLVKDSISLIDQIGRNGHPGNVIYCNETKQIFRSHREATRELGIDSRDLWAYLKGIKPDARGFTFTSVGEAQNKPGG